MLVQSSCSAGWLTALARWLNRVAAGRLTRMVQRECRAHRSGGTGAVGAHGRCCGRARRGARVHGGAEPQGGVMEHDYETIATITVLRCRRTGQYAAAREDGCGEAGFETLDALMAVQCAAIVRELRKRPTLPELPAVLPAPDPLPRASLPDAVAGERP